MQGQATPISAKSAAANNLFTIGADLLGEVQRIIGTSRVRALRVKIGNRTVKEVPVAPLTALTTVLLVALAVVVSNMSIEVEHDPAASEARP